MIWYVSRENHLDSVETLKVNKSPKGNRIMLDNHMPIHGSMRICLAERSPMVDKIW